MIDGVAPGHTGTSIYHGWQKADVRWCSEHQGVADVDEDDCDMVERESDAGCVLHDLYFRRIGWNPNQLELL